VIKALTGINVAQSYLTKYRIERGLQTGSTWDRHGLTGDRVNEPLDRQERRQRRIRHGPHRSGARRSRDRVHSGTTLISCHEVLAAFAKQHLGDPALALPPQLEGCSNGRRPQGLALTGADP
jgi:hypothetical protein